MYMEDFIVFVLSCVFYLLGLACWVMFCGLIVWPCWNVVMPLLGLHKITYLGGCCLYTLLRLLFARFNKFSLDDVRGKVQSIQEKD